MKYHVTVNGSERVVEIEGDRVSVDGESMALDLSSLGEDRGGSLLLDGRSYRVAGEQVESGEWRIEVDGDTIPVTALTERMMRIREMSRLAGAEQGIRPLKAPMPGLVIKVEVSVGDAVEAGQGLAIVEAMKMENELTAPGAGTVTAVHVDAGDTVEKDQVLIEFE